MWSDRKRNHSTKNHERSRRPPLQRIARMGPPRRRYDPRWHHGSCTGRNDRCGQIGKETTLQKIMNVPDDLLYSESHEWVRRDGDTIRVGITDHAQAEMTDVVYVELDRKSTRL